MPILYRYFQQINRLNEPVAIAVPGDTDEAALHRLRVAGWVEVSRSEAMSTNLPVYLQMGQTNGYVPNYYHVLFERTLEEHAGKALAYVDYYVCGRHSEFEVCGRWHAPGTQEERKNACS